jgi:hypothetical protein
VKLAPTLVLLLAGCVSTLPAPHPPDRDLAAHELLPGDLDCVVRLDWHRLSSTPLAAAARARMLARLSEPSRAVVGRALDHATAVWVGLRWMSDGFAGDGATAIEADLSDVPLGTDGDPRWRPGPAALVRDAVEFVPAAAPTDRADAAALLKIGARGIVVATPAEADALERVLRDGPDPRRIDPPAEGHLSLAARFADAAPRALTSSRGGWVIGRIGEGLERAEATVDVGEGAVVRGDLAYQTPQRAEQAATQAAAAVKSLAELGDAFAALAESTRLEPRGELVSWQATVPLALVLDPP